MILNKTLKKLLRTISTPAAKSATFFYFGSFALSIFRYFFHLTLMHFLVPAEYGEFLSYLSLIYLLSIPTITISNVVTKYVAEFQGRGDKVAINSFFYYLLKRVTPLSILVSIVLILFSSPLAHILKGNILAFTVLGISFFVTIYQTIIIAFISAFQRFVFQTVASLVGVVTTIAISILLIHLGFGATGAVVGQLLGGVINALVIFINIRSSIIPRSTKVRNFSIKGLLGYSFVYALGTMSLISTDVLVVRAIFDPHLSGIYSSLSVLARMILFGLTPIISLVLPIASHRQTTKGTATMVFTKLGAVLLIFGLIGAGIFSLFPGTIIRLLSGTAYIEAAPLLSVFSFTMVFFALSQFILSYLMAVGRSSANLFLLFTTILQPIFIYLSRTTISSVIWANFFLHLSLVSVLVIFFFKSRSNSFSKENQPNNF